MPAAVRPGGQFRDHGGQFDAHPFPDPPAAEKGENSCPNGWFSTLSAKGRFPACPDSMLYFAAVPIESAFRPGWTNMASTLAFAFEPLIVAYNNSI